MIIDLFLKSRLLKSGPPSWKRKNIAYVEDVCNIFSFCFEILKPLIIDLSQLFIMYQQKFLRKLFNIEF